MKKFLSLLACGTMLASFAASSHAQVSIDQVKMGPGNALTLVSAGGLTSPFTVTFPNPGAAANVILSTTSGGTQTINGTVDFPGTVNFTSTPALPLAVDQIFIGNGASPSVAAASGTLLTVDHTTGALSSAASINAGTNYQIGASTVLSIPGPSGFENLYVGKNAGNTGADFTYADANIAIGDYTLTSLHQGRDNVAIGFDALSSTVGSSTFGDGIDNVGIGSLAGYTNTSGSHNTYLGRETHASAGTFDGATAIGYQASVTGSNMMQLGSPSLVAVNTSAPITTGDGSAHAGALKITDGGSNTVTLNNAGGSAGTFQFGATGGTLATTTDITNAVGAGTAGQVAFYQSTGNAIVGDANLTDASGQLTYTGGTAATNGVSLTSGYTAAGADASAVTITNIQTNAAHTNKGLVFNVQNGGGNWDVAGTSNWHVTSGGAGTFASLALTTALPIASGGTNSGTALSGNSIMVSNGTQIVQGTINATATNEFLTQSSSGAPAWNTIQATDVPDLSGSYIKNTSSLQAGAQFNIGSNGTIGGAISAGNASGLTNNIGNNSQAAGLTTTNIGVTSSTAHTAVNIGGGTATTTTTIGGTVDVSGLANGVVHATGGAGTLASSLIVNADVDPAAAIAYSKLALTSSIVNGDISGTAGIAYSKLNLSGSIAGTDLAAGAVNLGSAVVTGLLGVGNGGTGANLTLTTGDLIDAASGTAMGNIADVATGTVLVSGGVGAAPSYSATPTLGASGNAGSLKISDASGNTATIDNGNGSTATWSLPSGATNGTLASTAQLSGFVVLAPAAAQTIAGDAGGDVPLAIKDNAAGTAHLLDFESSAPSVIAYVDHSGNISAAASYAIGGTVEMSNHGTQNIFVGETAGNLTTSGTGGNAGLGYGALNAIGSGAFNAAVGPNAMQLTSGGNDNAAVGSSALYSNTGGSYNTAMGAQALESANTNDNTAVGGQTLQDVTSGTLNTAIGWAAGHNGTPLTTGSDNTLVGASSAVNNANAQNRTAIGYGANATADNSIQLGNGSVTLVNTSGNITTSGGATVTGATTINSTGSATTTIGNYNSGTPANSTTTNLAGTNVYSYASSGGASSYTVPQGVTVVEIADDGTGTGVAVTLPSGTNGQLLYIHNADAQAETNLGIPIGATWTFVYSGGAWHHAN